VEGSINLKNGLSAVLSSALVRPPDEAWAAVVLVVVVFNKDLIRSEEEV
jgi:hypothetical protein